MIEVAHDQWSYTDWQQALRAHCAEEGLRDPVAAYYQQQQGAARRGIEWRFTFETWWDFWRDHYHLRGGAGEQLCMARRGDIGPYAPWNVYKATNAQNIRDYYEHSHSVRERREAKRLRAEEKARLKVPVGPHEWMKAYLKFREEFVGPPEWESTPAGVQARIDRLAMESETRSRARKKKSLEKCPAA